ncbi:MAG TPA: hypothetical protein ENK71_01320 [Epsilonproteobacteria bacterium]|nr:hypothetical protein [Campylobacterota bacterium]
MSRYRVILSLFFSLMLLGNTVQAKEQIPVSEDSLIVYALWFDEQNQYAQSREIYADLYDRTGAKEYLFREATASLMSKSYVYETITRLQEWEQKYSESLETKRLLIPLFLTVNEKYQAKQESEYLLERSGNLGDLELASNSFLYTGEFRRALDLLLQVYEETLNENILLRIAMVMDEYTDQRKEILPLLESHRRIHGGSEALYLKLIQLYIKEKNIEALLTTYKALYANYPTEEYMHKILFVFGYKRDVEGAIAFLEENPGYEMILYDLYKVNKVFDKALDLLDTFYKSDHNAKWLAEKAVLLFEQAEHKDDKAMLDSVVDYFELAMKQGVDDSLYLNYYGYTLIDKEYDVKKGVDIIEEALKQQPDNTFYLDSLAWGYYKQNRCEEAYEVMKGVVEAEGLGEPEIAQHWDAIQKCR